MKKVVLSVVLFFVGTAAAFAMDNLPTGKEGANVAVGVMSSGFNFTPEKVRNSFETKIASAYLGTRYDFKKFGIGLDVGGARIGVEKIFMDHDDSSSDAFFLRPVLNWATSLNETFKTGGSFSYAFISGSSDQRSEDFINWQGTEKISMGPTHIFTLTAPMIQWQPLTDAALYAGFTSRFIQMNPVRIRLSAPLNDQQTFEANVNARDSYGVTLGATYALGKSVALGVQGQSLSNNGSGIQGEMSIHF